MAGWNKPKVWERKFALDLFGCFCWLRSFLSEADADESDLCDDDRKKEGSHLSRGDCFLSFWIEHMADAVSEL